MERHSTPTPDWVILSTIAVAGRHSNGTTAVGTTRNGNTIEVSLSLGHPPPNPSIVFVHSSDMNPAVSPTIVCEAGEALLLYVNVGSEPYSRSDDRDYFVYRAHRACPSLHRLRRPHPYFNRFDVGILPRSDGQYTVAALISTGEVDQYKLHLFHSNHKPEIQQGSSDPEIQQEQGYWSCCTLTVEAPQREFPVKIPRNSARIHRHLTTKVITIGGEAGTMGWVDHWRGVLFCDVLDPNPSLRGVPLPLPMKELSYNNGQGFEFGPGGQRRGISFIRDDKGHVGCLKLVHLEISDVLLPFYDDETEAPNFRIDSWSLTTWSNTRMTDSYEDWHQECMIQASDIRIDNPAVSQVLEACGFLTEQLALHNMQVSQPALCVNDEEEIVYLVARKKYKHPDSWILAVDIKNGKVHAVEKFAHRVQFDSTIIYCPSIISKYINPATTPVGKDAEE